MVQTQRLGTVATTVRTENGTTFIRYHRTDVVAFNARQVTLNTGGYRTLTTKTRMNQAANQFGLGFQVFQKNFDWFVHYANTVIPFNCDTLKIERADQESEATA